MIRSFNLVAVLLFSAFWAAAALAAEQLNQYYPFGTSGDGYVNNSSGDDHSTWKVRKVNGSNNEYNVIWGKDRERFKIRNYQGTQYIFVNAFGDDLGNWWGIRSETVQIRHGNGAWQTIVDGDMYGKPVGLYHIPNQHYTIRVWGYIKKTDGSRGRDFFWQQKWFPPANVTNTQWQGSSANTRLAVKKRQCWWDSRNGWNSGSGQMSNNKPNGNGITYGRQSTLGKNVGYQWTFWNMESGVTGGLSRVEPWPGGSGSM